MYGDDSQSKDDKVRKRHSLDSEIIMKESDFRKKLLQKEAAGMEIRRLKRDQERLHIVVQEKEDSLNKLISEIAQLEADIKKLKKEQNLL